MTVKEANRTNKGKVDTRTVPISDAKYGFFDPKKGVTDKPNYESLSTGDQKIAEQLAEYDYDPTRLSMRSGASAANTKKIYEAAYEINPNYSMGDYANVKAYKATWNKAIAPGGNLARVGTAINHLAELKTIVGDLKGQSNLQIKNKIVNYAKEKLGNPNITSFNQAVAAVSSELAGAYKGNSSPSESDREERGKTIGIQLSPAQFDSWIKTAANLLYGKTSNDAFNYEQTVGVKPKPIIKQDSINFLKQYGVDVSQDYAVEGGATTEIPATPGATTAASKGKAR